MNLCQYFQTEIEVEPLIETLKQSAAHLLGEESLRFELVDCKKLLNPSPQISQIQEEYWEAEKTQLCLRIQTRKKQDFPYNIQASLFIEENQKAYPIIWQLFDSSENPWPKELYICLQVNELSQFDQTRQDLRKLVDSAFDQTDSPQYAIGNINAALAEKNFELAQTFIERCWKQYQNTYPNQWWLQFCELRRKVLEELR